MCERLVSEKVLTGDDWVVIELVHKVLKPFKSDMIVLEGESYVTISFFTQ